MGIREYADLKKKNCASDSYIGLGDDKFIHQRDLFIAFPHRYADAYRDYASMLILVAAPVVRHASLLNSAAEAFLYQMLSRHNLDYIYFYNKLSVSAVNIIRCKSENRYTFSNF